MKERPILFNAPMVQALLSGQKTQTRRIVKPQFEREPVDVIDGVPSWDMPTNYGGEVQMNTTRGKPCRYGQPGDHLYVKETFYAFGRWETRYSEKKKRDEWHFVDLTLECDRAYQFDTSNMTVSNKRGVTPGWYKRPSIFMPQVASRITLEITGVRVERLQDISEADAKVEGADCLIMDNCTAAQRAFLDLPLMEDGNPYRNGFALLWESINGDGSWEANPCVWVVEFERIKIC